MERTPAYQFTVRMENGKPVAEDQAKLDVLKNHIKWYNTQVKKEDGQKYGRLTGVYPLYVKLQGRLGKDNPAAAKYRTGHFNAYQCIHHADAQTADVYVYQRAR